jgi:hypothetical protein
MQLTDDHLTEFQMLYRKHFGVDLTKEEALEKGLRLIRLMEVVLKESAKNFPQPLTH